jgi:phosphoribosyl-ATP pyrophosphohydrolase
MLSGQKRQQQSFNDSYTALILKEAEKLYNKLTTELTNSVIAATAAIMESSSSWYQNRSFFKYRLSI